MGALLKVPPFKSSLSRPDSLMVFTTAAGLSFHENGLKLTVYRARFEFPPTLPPRQGLEYQPAEPSGICGVS